MRFLNRIPPPRSRLFIHCGLHKTGTTALQVFLRNNTESLRNSGLLYPHAGCVDAVASGHHNIAWEITRDRRFDKAWGDIETLAKEIGNFSGDILLSSEGFEGALGRPEAFTPLVQYATSTQREVVLIVYVRNQISYLESLYCEMLGHGFGEEYSLMAGQALNKKECVMKEWVFHFDYQRIVEKVTSIPNIRLLLRNYHLLKANSIAVDFVSLLLLDSALCKSESARLRSNVRDTPLMSLSLFCQNRLGRPLNNTEIEVLEHLCGGNQIQLVTGKPLRDALIKAFRKTNKRFCRKYNVPSEGLLFNDVRNDAAGSTVYLERFFSFETQRAIKDITSFRTRSDLSHDQQTAAMAETERGVQAWWANGEASIAHPDGGNETRTPSEK